MVGLPKDPNHLLVFSSLQSLHFKHFLSIPDHNLELPRAGSLESQLLVCQWTRHRQPLQRCLYLMTPVHRRIWNAEFGFVQVVVKLTTSSCASCSLQAAASSLEAEGCVLDIHVLHTQVVTMCFHSNYIFYTYDTL